MIYIGKRCRGPRAGLTLAELVVAAGILAVITVFSAQVMGDVSRVWLGGKGRSDTFTTARALLTRLRIDLERSLPTPDLPGFVRDPSMEQLAFSTRVQGVLDSGSSGGGGKTVARPLSFVRYSLGPLGSEDGGYLIREDRAFSWDESPFGAAEGTLRPRRLSPDVVGFAHRFVQRDGELGKQYVPAPASNQTVGVYLALAVSDDRTFQTLKLTGQLAQVSESFSSLEPEKWGEAVDGETSGLPPIARQGIRVFHQVVSLPSARKEN